ncbi:hypothetical protein SUGI_0874350 [Cryptomeria japonica]|nr:hypothetical protein SUGI_0874350 [Cryptomeria japonica]
MWRGEVNSRKIPYYCRNNGGSDWTGNRDLQCGNERRQWKTSVIPTFVTDSNAIPLNGWKANINLDQNQLEFFFFDKPEQRWDGRFQYKEAPRNEANKETGGVKK